LIPDLLPMMTNDSLQYILQVFSLLLFLIYLNFSQLSLRLSLNLLKLLSCVCMFFFGQFWNFFYLSKFSYLPTLFVTLCRTKRLRFSFPFGFTDANFIEFSLKIHVLMFRSFQLTTIVSCCFRN
jgi:hypothetical protein